MAIPVERGMMESVTPENIEVRLLLESIYLKYGYDFRRYARASLKRRIAQRISRDGLESISHLQHKILYDINFFERLLQDLSINTTEMFRNPSFFRALRTKVLPELKKLPAVKIWVAGCSTGEEVYSLAILLQEEGLYEKTLIYATDFNQAVLQKAKDGIFPVDRIQEYTLNYQKSGGVESFADYYTAGYDSAIIKKSLNENIVFADHNLVTDSVFGEMHLILCRNVLIYFNRDLQDRVFELFSDSLSPKGFLCLGAQESIRFSSYSDMFEDFVQSEKIYRKVK